MHLSASSEVMGRFRSTFPKPRRQAASPLREARRREPAVVCQQPPVVGSTQFGGRQQSRPRSRPDCRNRGEPVVKCPAEAIARRPTSTWRGPTCGSSGRCSRPPARGPASEYVALQQRGSSGPVNESIRAGLGRPLLDHGPEQSRDVASPHCCFDEPARGPSACSRPGGGRLSKRITLLWSRSLRLAKHQRGSGSPASMASDSWIAASMQQSDAEIDTIAARPEHQ